MEQIHLQVVPKKEHPLDILDFSTSDNNATHSSVIPEKFSQHPNDFYNHVLSNSIKASNKYGQEISQDQPSPVAQAQILLNQEKVYSPHNQALPSNKIFECPYCTYKSNRSCNLTNHLQTHYLERLFADPACNYCATLNNYKLDLISNTSEGQMHSCTQCNYFTSTVDSAVQHFKSHFDENSCICPHQRLETGTYVKADRDSPKKEESSKHSKIFRCPQCDYIARRHQNLKRHLISHTGARPHSCTVCRYKAPDMSSLKVHMKTHTGERPHECPHCPYRASQKSTLRNHIKIHTGEKPYACTYCSYRSSNQTNLNSHIKTHTGEKPYACPHCSYCATQSSALKCHLRTHTGEKPYECPHCPYRAAALGNLRSHLKVHANTNT